MCFVISLLALWRNKQSKKHLDWSDTINRKQPLVLSGYPHCRYREEDKDLETQMLAKGLRLATLRQRKESQVWCLWNRLRHPLHFKRRTFVNIYFFFCPCRLSSYRVSSVHGIPSVLRKNDLKKNVVNFFFQFSFHWRPRPQFGLMLVIHWNELSLWTEKWDSGILRSLVDVLKNNLVWLNNNNTVNIKFRARRAREGWLLMIISQPWITRAARWGGGIVSDNNSSVHACCWAFLPLLN